MTKSGVDVVVEHLRRTPGAAAVILDCADASAADEVVGEEAAAIASWTALRQREFAMGRVTARRALAALGFGPCSIPFDGDGVPRWPVGATGSITHKRGSCIVAVGAGNATAIGVDLERDARDRHEADVAREVCATPREFAALRALERVTATPATLVLAVKEAFFKAQFPSTRQWLRWADVEVDFADDGYFAARRTDVAGCSAVGSYAVARGWIAALITL